MKYLDEFREPALVARLAEAIAAAVTRPWSVMEICGGQTHTILRFGLDRLLPAGVRLVHGPGCPVCVTPIEMLDKAIAIAGRPGVIFCSFGDMVRVPGSSTDLLGARARGADVRVVYSPLDAVALAAAHPDRQVVFFAVGFETTAPANALAAHAALAQGLGNFSLLVSHVLVPPALASIAGDPENQVDAFLAAGHVCTIAGIEPYRALAERLRVPIVVTGFEPVDLLHGLHRAILQLEAGRAEVENAYPRVVAEDGNPRARSLVAEVFQVVPRKWRGLGTLAASGLGLCPAYRTLDAEERFGVGDVEVPEPAACQAGRVLRGLLRPDQCPAFGTTCTPLTPLGAPMVSSEGACAAYHRYRPPTVPRDD